MNPHQTAKAAAKMTVMAVEISNESAASLIQSVTAHNFQSAQLPRPSCGSSQRYGPAYGGIEGRRDRTDATDARRRPDFSNRDL